MKNKTGAIIGVILLVCLACGLGFVMFLGILHTDIRNFRIGGRVSERLALDKEFSYEEIKAIQTDSDAANIKFLNNTESDKIGVKIYADESKIVRAEKESDKLDISIKGTCEIICLNFTTDRIEISIPEKYVGDFTINSDAGDIESEILTMTNFTIRSDAGKIKIPAAKNLDIKADAATIELGSIENIVIKSDAGKIKINDCFGRLDIEGDATKIEIGELQLSHNSYIKSDAGKIKIDNAGNIRINTEGDVTKFNINNNHLDSDIELTITVDAGTVDVN